MRCTPISIFATAFAAAGPAAMGLAEPVALVRWNSQYVDGDTVRVWADVTISGADSFRGFASSIFDVLGDDTLSQSLNHAENQGLGRMFQLLGTSEGTDNLDNILAVDEAQLPFDFNPGLNDSGTLPDFFVFEYSVIDFTPRSITYTSHHLNFDIYVNDQGTNVPCTVQVFDTTFDIPGNVIPLPTPVLLASAGLGILALRRWAR